MNEIDSNFEGSIFCVPYNDNGRIKMVVFKNTGEITDTLNLNTICDIDEMSKPVVGFMNPLATACFDHNNIFVNVFHRIT